MVLESTLVNGSAIGIFFDQINADLESKRDLFLFTFDWYDP